MTKEQKIRECESKQLIDELSKMPPMVIATAYLHAINYTRYGVDVTEAWVTATKQAYALDKARSDGYYDALKRMSDKWIPVSEKLPDENVYCLCCDEEGYMAIGCISKWSKQWSFDDPEIDIDVIAWMPLPKPYKAESEG